MRGWRVKLIKDVKDAKGRIRAKEGQTGTILSEEIDDKNQVRINIDRKHYPINDMPFEFLQRINDKGYEIPAGGWR